MSRIGKQLIKIPSDVSVSLKDGMIVVKGPKGELKRVLNKLVTLNIQDNVVTVDVQNKEDKKERSLWGTFAAHIKNMIMTMGNSASLSKYLQTTMNSRSILNLEGENFIHHAEAVCLMMRTRYCSVWEILKRQRYYPI